MRSILSLTFALFVILLTINAAEARRCRCSANGQTATLSGLPRKCCSSGGEAYTNKPSKGGPKCDEMICSYLKNLMPCSFWCHFHICNDGSYDKCMQQPKCGRGGIITTSSRPDKTQSPTSSPKKSTTLRPRPRPRPRPRV